MWALIAISVGIVAWGSSIGFEASDGQLVDVLLNWAYIMAGMALVIVIGLGIAVSAANDPKSLLKFGIGLVVVAVICAIAYALAPGAPAVGYVGAQPTGTELKRIDTILNLTYLIGAIAITAIVIGEIINAVRNK